MQKLLPLSIGCACALLLSPVSLWAKGPKAADAGPVSHHTTIASVDASSITILDGAGVSKTYNVSPLTDVTINGEMSKVTDLQPGMSVQVSVDGDSISSISATNAVSTPAAAATPPPKKGKGKGKGGKAGKAAGGATSGGGDAGGGDAGAGGGE